MNASSVLESCFPELDESKKEQLIAFEASLRKRNQEVNLVSRKEEAYMERHIIPSLFPLKVLDPPEDAEVADIGTGGGLPGLPMAIVYPQMRFLLLDSTRKKLDAIERMADDMGLDNVQTEHQRLEKSHFQADLITGRAVMPLPRFVALCRKHLARCSEAEGERGILYWTGGDIQQELDGLQAKSKVHRMADHFSIPDLASKKLVHIQPQSAPTSN